MSPSSCKISSARRSQVMLREPATASYGCAESVCTDGVSPSNQYRRPLRGFGKVLRPLRLTTRLHVVPFEPLDDARTLRNPRTRYRRQERDDVASVTKCASNSDAGSEQILLARSADEAGLPSKWPNLTQKVRTAGSFWPRPPLKKCELKRGHAPFPPRCRPVMLSGRAILSLPERPRVLVASYIGTQKFVPRE
jgi:hypothetical protein